MAKTDPEVIKREKRKNIQWVVTIFLTTILISGTISLVSDQVMAGSSIVVAFCILLAIIFLGIVFDIIGVAVTASDPKPFHSMASRSLFWGPHSGSSSWPNRQGSISGPPTKRKPSQVSTN